ncbi:MAG: IS1634 family transposase [Betaproteobacteria bacterium]
MASIIAKRKANQLYYYVVESARVQGKPRIVQQTYLGTAERVAALVKDRAAPLPLAATALEFGLPGSLWLAALQSGAWEVLESFWPRPRSGPSTAHYLLLAALHRICRPGPKTEVADWYRRTVLHSLWGLPAERFTSQAFWDCFDQIHTGTAAEEDDELEQAQSRLLAAWKDKQLVSRRLLAYDTTNFYTYVASTNARNTLAQRGHNKQGRHNLRQVGLSYVLDGEHGLSLCHHVYPGNVADADELPVAVGRVLTLLDRHGIPRDTVTLVLDKGSAALANTLELEQAGVGWISALPWNQAPEQLRERSAEQLLPLSSAQPGVRAAAERVVVHGKEYLAVVKYSAPFASEQLHSLTTTLAKALQSMRRLSVELAKPGGRFTETGLRHRIGRWLSGTFVADLVRYELERRAGRWRLQFDFDNAAFERLLARRLGRTVLLTNRLEWTAEQVVEGYSGQQQIERVFRGLKAGEWLGWGPMHHWTDSKIRVHAFYCMLGISLLQSVYKKAATVWPGLSMEQLIEELDQIQQFTLLYPPQGDKGPNRVATVLSKQTLAQQSLAEVLALNSLRSTQLR